MDVRIPIAVKSLTKCCHGKVDLAQVATALNLSKSRLQHLIRAEIGLPPGKYIKLLKMRRACELLRTTFLSVKEISAQVGINDTSHFVRDFRKRFAVTPTDYRHLHMKRGTSRSRARAANSANV